MVVVQQVVVEMVFDFVHNLEVCSSQHRVVLVDLLEHIKITM